MYLTKIPFFTPFEVTFCSVNKFWVLWCCSRTLVPYAPFFSSKEFHILLLFSCHWFFFPSNYFVLFRKFWLHMVLQKLVLMWLMLCSLSNHMNVSWHLILVIGSSCKLAISIFSAIQTSCCLSFLFLAAGPGDQFAYFWITDSCPHTVKTVKAIGQRPPFEVLSLAGSIADALQIWACTGRWAWIAHQIELVLGDGLLLFDRTLRFLENK